MSPEDRPIHPPRDPLHELEPVVVPRSQVTVKTVFTVCAVVMGTVLAAYVLIHSVVTLTFAVVSALLAVALQHAVDLLQRWGVGRRLAVGVVVAGLMGSLAGAAVLVVPEVIEQVRQLVDHLPGYVEQVRGTGAFRWLQERFDIEQQIASQKGEGGMLKTAVAPALHALSAMFAGLTGLITILFMSIFMLLYGGRLMKGLLAEALPAHRERYERVLSKVYVSVGGYLTGMTVIALINAAGAALFLAFVGVPYFLPLGILSGLGSLVPLVGASLSGLVLSLVALLTGGVTDGVLVAVYVSLYQVFENHALGPVIYRRTVELNPLVTLLGVVLFAELAGVVGAFLAVPVVGAAQIIVRELFLLRRERLELPLTGDVAEQVRPERRMKPWRRPRPA